MSGGVIVDGRRWWTTDQAVAQLDVGRKTINQWVVRSRRAGHVSPDTTCRRCAAGGPGFPHLDPPVRRGQLAGYLADQLLAVEAHTAGI